jgi:UDP-N-acetylglucosamine enolpyruvyl transferase
MAEGTTYITNEELIERGYDNIIQKLTEIWVKIKQIPNE